MLTDRVQDLSLTLKGGCTNCVELRKQLSDKKCVQFQLQYEKAELQNKIDKLNAEILQLQTHFCLTYEQYENKLQLGRFNDLQAERKQSQLLSEIISAIVNGKSKETKSHLVQKLELEQQLAMKDRLIAQENFFPLLHYDKRILALRGALKHCLTQISSQCVQLKRQMQEVRGYSKTLFTSLRQQYFPMIEASFETCIPQPLRKPTQKKVLNKNNLNKSIQRPKCLR